LCEPAKSEQDVVEAVRLVMKQFALAFNTRNFRGQSACIGTEVGVSTAAIQVSNTTVRRRIQGSSSTVARCSCTSTCTRRSSCCERTGRAASFCQTSWCASCGSPGCTSITSTPSHTCSFRASSSGVLCAAAGYSCS
jgi:hypothetical protein